MLKPVIRTIPPGLRLSRSAFSLFWLGILFLLPSAISAQMILPTQMELGFHQAQLGVQIRGNYVLNDVKAGATENHQIRPSFILSYNLKPRPPLSMFEFVGAMSSTGKKLTRYAVVDGASLRLGIPEAPVVDGRSFRPLELANYDQYALFELMYKRRNIRKLDLGLYRLLNFCGGLSMSQHYLDFRSLPQSPAIDEAIRTLPMNERFSSMTLTIGAEYMPWVVLNDWVPSFHAGNYGGRTYSKYTNARLTAWDRTQPAAYAFAVRPYFRFTRLLGGEAPQIDKYLGMREDADFRWLIGPGVVVDGTYEWVSVYARVSSVWALGSGGAEIPGLTSQAMNLSLGVVLTPSWTRNPRLRLQGTALQWK